MRASLVILSLALASTSAFALPHSFDGDWIVEARTTVGSCPVATQETISIKEGRVIGNSADGVAPWGYVDDGGVIQARFTQGEHIVRGQGKLKGVAGSGAWSSNTDYCGGVWTARKVD